MNDARYKVILYIIVAVIVGTISIQFYWNYKNYEINKQQLTKVVQASLDNAVETYYANLAKKNTIGFAIEATSDDILGQGGKFDSILSAIQFQEKGFKNMDSLRISINNTDGIQIFEGLEADSLSKALHNNSNHQNHLKKRIEYNSSNSKKSDSLIIDDFKILTSKVIFSMSQDTLSLTTIDSLLKQDRETNGMAYTAFTKS
jgi:two-component system phosphate regulon sensor histidine kinase PhoR